VAHALRLEEADAVEAAVAGAADDQESPHRNRQISRDQVMTNPTTTLSRYALRLRTAVLAIIALSLLPTAALAQQKFKTPDEAVSALVAAVRADKVRDMVSVLGTAAQEIVLSGDDVADQKARAAFLIAYDAKHQIVKKGETSASLVVGQSDWELPIPIVETKGSWQFDAAQGREEVLFRRIGANELFVIQMCLAYVDAQNEYATMNPQQTRVDSYAQRFISSPGKKDGLYWPSSANEPRSPLGEQAALATREGYRFGQSPIPYHGYYFKILTSQGPTAPGGAVNYIYNGNMIGGFALVAYPAEYGNSGVMTFLVNHTGMIFQKDLGSKTERVASRITEFSPDHTWKRVSAEDMAIR